MSNLPKSLNDTAWEQLFSKYDILNQIDANGRFEISATQIKEFREPLKTKESQDQKNAMSKVVATSSFLPKMPI